MRTYFKLWLAATAGLCFLVIIFLADRQDLPGAITSLYAFPYGDKVGHFCMMGGLSFCVNLAVGGCTLRLRGRSFLLGSLLVAIAVTLEEFSQIFIAGRSFDLLDLSASLLGIWLLGHAAGWLSNIFNRGALPQ